MEPKFGTRGNHYPNAHPHSLFIRSRGHPCGAYFCFVSFVGVLLLLTNKFNPIIKINIEAFHLSDMVQWCTASFPGCEGIKMKLLHWRRQMATVVLNSEVVLKEYSGNAESMMEDYSKLMATSVDMVVRHYDKGRYDQQAKRAQAAMDKLILDLNPEGSFHHSLAFLASSSNLIQV
jgi:hypothetical protein